MHIYLMQGVGWEAEKGVSVNLHFIYRSALKQNSKRPCHAEAVKMNIVAY